MTIKFFPRQSKEGSARFENIKLGIDFLIQHDELNPMKANPSDSLFWNWGILDVDGYKLPAPHTNTGYDAMGQKYELTSEESATVNTFIFLDHLIRMTKFGVTPLDVTEVRNPIVRMMLGAALGELDRLGVEKVMSIHGALQRVCSNNGKLRAIID